MNARSTIDLTQFEQIEAGSGTVLLRLAAAASAELSPTQRPILLVDDGERTHRLAALPAPPDPGGVFRAAYPAPVSLVGPETTFSLELPGGAAVALPTPSARRREVGDELAEERRLRQEAEQRAEARAQADALQTELTAVQHQTQAEAEQHADELRTLREQAATERMEEVDRLRAELAAQAERAAAIAADLQAGVEIARAEATQHRDDAQHVRSQLEQAQAAATGAERRAAERAAELERLRDQADSAREVTAEAEQTASERAAEVARLRSELERHTDAAAARASELQAQVEIATADAESTATHRITALEAVIDSSIAEADEQRQRAEELQAEIERAQGETSDAAVDLQALIETAHAEARQHRARADQLQIDLDSARAEMRAGAALPAASSTEANTAAWARAEELETQLTHATAEAMQHRERADQIQAELDEAQTRADMLAEVVRVESARREENLTELTAARQTVERLERELREREAALARARDAAAQAPPGGTGHVAVGVPERIRSVTQALPAQALVGIALVVLGIVIAILFLTGALG